MQLQHDLNRRNTDLQRNDINHRQKNTGEYHERKNTGTEKSTVELIKQNTYEKKNEKNTKPEALISAKKTNDKRKQMQRMEKFGTKTDRWETNRADSTEHRIGHLYTSDRH